MHTYACIQCIPHVHHQLIHALCTHTYIHTYRLTTYTWRHREGSHLQTEERSFKRNHPENNLTGTLLLELWGSDSIFSVPSLCQKKCNWWNWPSYSEGGLEAHEPSAACLPTAAIMARPSVWKLGGWNHVHTWHAKTVNPMTSELHAAMWDRFSLYPCPHSLLQLIWPLTKTWWAFADYYLEAETGGVYMLSL